MTGDAQSTRRRGITRLSSDFIARKLGLPEGTQILDVRMSFTSPNEIELQVAHADLPVVREGETIPNVKAMISTKHSPWPFLSERVVRWRW